MKKQAINLYTVYYCKDDVSPRKYLCDILAVSGEHAVEQALDPKYVARVKAQFGIDLDYEHLLIKEW